MPFSSSTSDQRSLHPYWNPNRQGPHWSSTRTEVMVLEDCWTPSNPMLVKPWRHSYILKKFMASVKLEYSSLWPSVCTCHSSFTATIGTESQGVWGSKNPKKANESSYCVPLLHGVSTIPSTHDREQAWLVHLIISNNGLGNLQEILLMTVGLEIGRTDIETGGV